MRKIKVVFESELRWYRITTILAIGGFIFSAVILISSVSKAVENIKLREQSQKLSLEISALRAKIDRMQESGVFERFANHPVNKPKEAR